MAFSPGRPNTPAAIAQEMMYRIAITFSPFTRKKRGLEIPSTPVLKVLPRLILA
jgi:hypothetical protein